MFFRNIWHLSNRKWFFLQTKTISLEPANNLPNIILFIWCFFWCIYATLVALSWITQTNRSFWFHSSSSFHDGMNVLLMSSNLSYHVQFCMHQTTFILKEHLLTFLIILRISIIGKIHDIHFLKMFYLLFDTSSNQHI